MEDMRGDFGQSTAPVKVGDELDVTIEAVGAKGDGIAKKEGFVLFVPNVQKGDRARIRVTRVLRKAGFAEVVSKEAAGSPSESDGEADNQPDNEPEEQEAPVQSEEDSEDFGEDDGDEEENRD